jgi:C4-dicarboxylate-specific signal transduction histidine kinase
MTRFYERGEAPGGWARRLRRAMPVCGRRSDQIRKLRWVVATLVPLDTRRKHARAELLRGFIAALRLCIRWVPRSSDAVRVLRLTMMVRNAQTRTAQSTAPVVSPDAIENALQPPRQSNPGMFAALTVIPVVEDNISIAPLPIGLHDELENIASTDRSTSFAKQRRPGVGRAAAGRVARAQKLVTEELEQRFAQRSRELAAANDELTREIAERRRAEDQLRRNEAFLAEGQRLSLTGSFSWRVATGEITWSEQLYRIFELDQRSRVTTEVIQERIHPDDVSLLRERIGRAQADGANFELELRLRIPGQSIKHLHVIAHATRDKDGLVEYLGAVQDVTQRRNSEEALTRARSELAHVSRVTSLGVLTASIAHEVNQPLARRAAEIIGRIRGMASRRVPEQTHLLLDEVISESMTFLQHEFQSRGIAVSVDLAPSLPHVIGDRTQLQQVIVNLTINAVQAATQCATTGRIIFVRTKLSPPDNVCCTIEDSGPGIDPAHLSRLFDSFFTTKDSGMGMGLAISRYIIEAHGGVIRADNNSVLGGARFCFSLPASVAPCADIACQTSGNTG